MSRTFCERADFLRSLITSCLQRGYWDLACRSRSPPQAQPCRLPPGDTPPDSRLLRMDTLGPSQVHKTGQTELWLKDGVRATREKKAGEKRTTEAPGATQPLALCTVGRRLFPATHVTMRQVPSLRVCVNLGHLSRTSSTRPHTCGHATPTRQPWLLGLPKLRSDGGLCTTLR